MSASGAAHSSGSGRVFVYSDARIVRRLQRLSRACGVAAAFLASIVLCGRILQIELLKSVIPSSRSTRATTAILILLSALALSLVTQGREGTSLVKKQLARALAAMAIGGSLLSIAGRFVESGGMAQLVVDLSLMAPLSAITILLVGLSLIFLIRNGKRDIPLSQGLSLAGMFISFLVLFEYSFGPARQLDFFGYQQMAVDSALFLLILSFGVALARPDRGLLAAITAELPQTALLRRMLLAAIVSTVLLSWLRLFGDASRTPLEEASDSLYTGAIVAIIALLVWWSARQIVLLEEKRRTGVVESENRYRELFEHNVAGVFRSTLDGKIVECNDALALIYGYDSAEELKARPAEELYSSSEERDGFIALLREKKHLESLEYRSVRKDGSPVWTLENVALVKRRGVEYLEGTTFDVTEQRRDQLALREAKEYTDNLIKTANVMIVGFNTEGEIEIFNEAAEQLTGYSASELMGRNWFDTVVPKERYPSVWETFQAVKSAELPLPANFENLILTKSGGERMISWKNSAIFHEDRVVGSISFGLDVTESKSAEEAIRRSEERYRGLFEENPLPMWIYDRVSKRIHDVNRAAVDHYGYSKEEFLTLSLADLRPKDELPKFLAHAEERYDVATNLGVWKHRKKDGTPIDVEVTALDLTHAGRSQRLALLNDVTDRLRALEALRVSEEKYRELFDKSPESLILLSPDGTVLDANPTAEALAGVSKRDWVDRPFVEHVTEDDSAAIREALRLSRGGQAIGPFSVRLATAKRGPVPVEFIVAPVVAGGVATNILAIGRDVSERTRAEEEKQKLQDAIVQSAKEWRETFDAIQSPILIVDDRGVIQRANRAVDVISPGSFLELIGKPIESIARLQPWRKADTLIRELRGQSLSAEGMCQDDDGGRYWEVSVSRSSFGSVSRIIVVVRDVSGTVALQKSLRRSETMSAMGSIVAGVAHEVRNPLFAISATVDAFELRFGKTEEFRKYAEALRSQLERMKNLVQDLFDYGKPAALQLTDASFVDVVERAISHCQIAAREREVEIRTALSSNLPALRADSDRLVRVLINLVENAIQHSNPGKSIVVSAEVEERRGSAALECSVTDEGKGIPLEDLPHLFEPFFSRRSGGTGLGLAIVRRIVEEHGGSIDVANRAVAGAVFTFTLPLPDSSAASRIEDEAAS